MAIPWDFYGRQTELDGLLEKLRRRQWFFASVRGRRRIGKTALVQQALTLLAEDRAVDRPPLLIQLPDSTPADLAAVFRNALRDTGVADGLGHDAETIRDLPGVAAAVGSLCASGTIVALDEFQICHDGPLRALPSLLQAQVDRLQDQDEAGGLIVLGSVQAEMEALLQDRRAPLFGRTTFQITLHPWDLRTIFEVCDDHVGSDPSRWLTLCTLFGGVPKYWRHYAETPGLDAVSDWVDWASELCERLFLRSDAILREEGESLMSRELRRTCLAILRTLAERQVCTHAELREALPEQTSLGPYLRALTRDLRLVDRELPVFARESSRGARYVLSDPFPAAWLAVLQPACQAARIASPHDVARRLLPRLRILEGHAFERIVRNATEEASRRGADDFPLSDRVGGYWNRTRAATGRVEIDLVAWNDDERRIRFGSCKRSAAGHGARALSAFRDHVGRFLATREGARFRDWKQEFALYCPRFTARQRAGLEADGWTCRDLDDFRRMLCEDGRGQGAH